jgi:MmyB-like transcription regulator ligand binding domain
MQPLRESLERLLEAHEPNPALIVDGLWNLIESNRAASLLWDGVDAELLEPPINMLRLGVHPGGLPRISSMTAACNAPLIHRLKRRSREDADPALAKLIEEVESYPSRRAAGEPRYRAGGLAQAADAPWRGQAVHGHRHPRSPARSHGREPRDRDLPADGPRERSTAAGAGGIGRGGTG